MEYVTVSKESQPLYQVTKIIWYILDVIEVLLLFRFVLKLLGANSGAGFTHFIYSITYIFAEPFLNVFSVTRVTGATFEWSTLLAMLVYWLVAWGIIRLILLGRPISNTEASAKIQDQDVAS